MKIDKIIIENQIILSLYVFYNHCYYYNYWLSNIITNGFSYAASIGEKNGSPLSSRVGVQIIANDQYE